MVKNLVKREIRGRYKGSLLGFLWNIIFPLVQILVYIMIFTVVFRSGLENYAVYLVSGLVIWNWFSESISEGSETIVVNSDMVKKIYFPRIVLPIATVLSKMVNFLIMLCVMFAIIVIQGHGVNAYALLLLPVAIFFSFFFILGLTLIFSSIDVFFRDVRYIVSVVLMAWVWLTPIMYSIENIEDELVNQILILNPMTHVVGIFQDIIYWKTIPELTSIALCGLLSLIMMVVGVICFYRLEKYFAEVI